MKNLPHVEVHETGRLNRNNSTGNTIDRQIHVPDDVSVDTTKTASSLSGPSKVVVDIEDATVETEEAVSTMANNKNVRGDISITMALYTSNQILAGNMASAKEKEVSLSHYINILFKYTKFINSNKDMAYGGIICKKFIEYMKITTGAEAWWSGVDNKVRTGISTRWANAGTEIKKEFMSKFISVKQ